MAFRIIKEWLFSGLRRGRERDGQLCVSSEGECIITIAWTPTKVTVEFMDPDPPIDPCHPHPADQLSEEISWLGHGRWGVKIKWSVFGNRKVKYTIMGHAG